MELDTSLLRAFAGVARAGSINRAAAQLGRSQPALSQQIRKLEQLLGQTLLQRSTQGITLTNAGSALLPYAERMLALNDRLRAALAQPAAGGLARIGLLEDVADVHLSRVLADFAGAHPGIRLQVKEAGRVTLFESLARGELDIVVSTQPPELPASIREEALLRCPLAWFAAADWQPKEATLPLIAFCEPCTWRDETVAALRRAGLSWRIVFESDSLAAIQAAVEAGLGVAALWTDTPPAHSRRVDTLPALPAMPLGIYRPHSEAGAAEKLLVQLFQRELSRSAG